MAIRTTDELVKEIYDEAITKDLTPFISAASSLVDQVEENAENTYPDSQLILIETWLSAHFYGIFDPKFKSEKAGSVGSTIESKVDLGLNVTRYGQMAMQLDYQGVLAAINDQIINGGVKTVGVTWLGSTKSETLSYGDLFE